MIAKTKLLRKREVAEDVIEFQFEKPSGFLFDPGQFAFFKIPQGLNSNKPLTHHFTITSGPTDDYLAFATKMRKTEYKKALASLGSGDEIEVDGPMGTMVMPENKATPLIFIAGGIGITPFYSMIRHMIRVSESRMLTLFYQNKKPSEAAYIVELVKIIEGSQGMFKIFATMTNKDIRKKEWLRERGEITPEAIKEKANYWVTAPCYIAGPPGFVEQKAQMLAQMGVQQENIIKESFTGY